MMYTQQLVVNDPSEWLLADGEIINCHVQIAERLEKFAASIRSGNFHGIHGHVSHKDNPEALSTVVLTVTIHY